MFLSLLSGLGFGLMLCLVATLCFLSTSQSSRMLWVKICIKSGGRTGRRQCYGYIYCSYSGQGRPQLAMAVSVYVVTGHANLKVKISTIRGIQKLEPTIKSFILIVISCEGQERSQAELMLIHFPPLRLKSDSHPSTIKTFMQIFVGRTHFCGQRVEL